jgi:hypothetical protein
MALAAWSTIKKGEDNLIRMQEATLRADAELKATYQDTDRIDASAFTELNFLFKITKASLTSWQWKLYWSDNESDWYPVLGESVGLGTTTVAAQEYSTTEDENLCWCVRVKARYAKLQVKGTGTVAGSSLGVKVTGRY